MRRYSFFVIVLLCIVIVIVDLLAYYWLQFITTLSGSLFFNRLINVLFFTFMIGLVVAILFLKLKIDTISRRRRQLLISSLYGLTVSSLIPKAIFVLIISIFYFSNYVISEQQSVFVVPLVGLLSGVFSFLMITYAIFKSVYHFRVEMVRIRFDNLPSAFDRLRVVQFSDVHLGSFNYKYHILAKAFKKINLLHPDIIVFTGDLVNNYNWELEGWETTFNILDARIGKYAVLGNHDYGDYSDWENEKEKRANFKEILSFFAHIDFKLLRNESVQIGRQGASIDLIGVENWGKPPFKQYGDLRKALRQTSKTVFKLLLSHDPTHWKEEVLYKTNIDLTLSGHTHGAQAGVTYKNKSWSPIKFKYEHWGGLYSNNNQYLYVNRGLGWLGFPGRVGMRPEITCLDLFKKG